MTTRTIGLVLAGFALVLTACGGSDGSSDGSSDGDDGGGDRPSAAEVSNALTAKDGVIPVTVTEKQADCLAKILVESEISDDALNAIVEKDQGFQGNKKDAEELGALASKVTSECALS